MTRKEALALIQQRYPKDTTWMKENDIDLDCEDTITVWHANGDKDFFSRTTGEYLGSKKY